MSDNWFNTFDGVFFLSVASLFFGSVSLMVRYCLKSKCNEINLCGFIKVHRDINAEFKEFEIINNNKNIKNNNDSNKNYDYNNENNDYNL
jgi:hypothetical protein